MLYLKEANMEDAAKEYAFVSELPQCENGFTNECPGVSEEEFTSRVLPRMIAFARGEGLPAGYVPETSPVPLGGRRNRRPLPRAPRAHRMAAQGRGPHRLLDSARKPRAAA